MDKIDELTEMINSLNIEPVLKSQVRRVKWLFNNSNKNTMVYDEKLVRLIIHKFQKRISELEAKGGEKYLPTQFKDGY